MALLQKMTCNLRHLMSLRHTVRTLQGLSKSEHILTDRQCVNPAYHWHDWPSGRMSPHMIHPPLQVCDASNAPTLACDAIIISTLSKVCDLSKCPCRKKCATWANTYTHMLMSRIFVHTGDVGKCRCAKCQCAYYGVASVSRIDKIIGLFCKRAL